jgi:hypothetical protein
MKKLYIYSIIAIIVIVSMSILKGHTIQEGFQFSTISSRLKSYFKSQYFVIPLIMTIFIGPIIYFIYLHVLRSINKSLTAVANAPATV